MAVNTRQRRFSMMDFADGVILHALPSIDGQFDPDDRQHLLGLYSSGEIGPGVGSVAPPFEGTRRHTGRMLR